MLLEPIRTRSTNGRPHRFKFKFYAICIDLHLPLTLQSLVRRPRASGAAFLRGINVYEEFPPVSRRAIAENELLA